MSEPEREYELPHKILQIIPAAPGWRLVHYYGGLRTDPVANDGDRGWETDPIACWVLLEMRRSNLGGDPWQIVRPVTEGGVNHGADICWHWLLEGRYEVVGPDKDDEWIEQNFAGVMLSWPKDKAGKRVAPGSMDAVE